MRPDLTAFAHLHRTHARVFAVVVVLALLLAQCAGWWHKAHHALPSAPAASATHAVAHNQVGTDVVHHDAGSLLCLWLDHLLLAPAAVAVAIAWDAPSARPPVPTAAPRARDGEAAANAYAARAPPHLV